MYIYFDVRTERFTQVIQQTRSEGPEFITPEKEPNTHGLEDLLNSYILKNSVIREKLRNVNMPSSNLHVVKRNSL